MTNADRQETSGWAVAVRQRRAAVMHRVAVGVASAVAAAPLVGWRLTLAWGLAYMAIQVVEALAFAPINAGRTDSMGRVRDVLGGLVLAMNTGLYGLLSVPMWLIGGVPGGVTAGIMLPAAMIYSTINAPRSFAVLACTVTPQILYLASFPFLLTRLGASPAAAITVAGGGAIFSVYCLSAWRSLAERDRVERRDRLEAQRRMADMARDLEGHRAFLAAIGHDLRTPIGAILTGAAELRGADSHARANAGLITDAGLMMKALLDDLLDHSKIGAGRMSVEATDFNLRIMLAQTLRLWRGPAEAKGLRLRVEGANAMPAAVRGDAMRLRQVLNNLMSNAMKFTAEGAITLRLAAWAEEPSGYAVLIEVADTGPGMTADQLARLFTPFDQTADGVSALHGGSGLGLAISRDLVELMGGRLTARSMPGRGARFTVSLFLPRGENAVAPAEQAVDQSRLAVARALGHRTDDSSPPRPAPFMAKPDDIATAPEPEPTPAREPVEAEAEDRPLRLLVVDDHDINRRAIQLILEPLGCDIVTAADGLQALDRCAESAFDVIFMDVRMPELDGRETTRRLRAGGGPNARTPVVAVTADTAPEDIAACQAAGMAYFVSKPLTPPALIGALQHVLDDSAAAQETEAA